MPQSAARNQGNTHRFISKYYRRSNLVGAGYVNAHAMVSNNYAYGIMGLLAVFCWQVVAAEYQGIQAG